MAMVGNEFVGETSLYPRYVETEKSVFCTLLCRVGYRHPAAYSPTCSGALEGSTAARYGDRGPCSDAQRPDRPGAARGEAASLGAGAAPPLYFPPLSVSICCCCSSSCCRSCATVAASAAGAAAAESDWHSRSLPQPPPPPADSAHSPAGADREPS